VISGGPRNAVRATPSGCALARVDHHREARRATIPFDKIVDFRRASSQCACWCLNRRPPDFTRAECRNTMLVAGIPRS
jgi:hypothetical protein